MNIAFCLNQKALSSLGYALSSLLINCRNTSLLNIYIIHEDLSANEICQIKSLLLDLEFQGESVFCEFCSAREFSHLKSLHGDWVTYSRLKLPSLINETYVLYLDTDILVELDVLSLDFTLLQNHAISAVPSGTLKTSLDGEFLSNACGLDISTSYFNAGVLFLNLDLWRNHGIERKIFNLNPKYYSYLPCVDQTLLNAFCRGEFGHLPQNWNATWPAGFEKPDFSSAVFHAIGSPKPWEIFSSFLHSGHGEWKKYLPSDKKIWCRNWTYSGLCRHWAIRKSYARCIRNSLLKTLRFF